nr:hypothetical protein [Tanacetum cinerariifolium]
MKVFNRLIETILSLILPVLTNSNPRSIVHQPPQETSTEILLAQENLMEAIQVFLKKYDQIPSEEKCIALLLAEEKFFKVKQALEEEQNQPENEKGINKQAQKKQEEKSIAELLAEEQAPRINYLFQDHNPSQFFINLDGDDDDENYDKEIIISMNTYIFETPPSIVISTSPIVLPIKDTEDSEDSLIMGNEELNTIPKKESNEFIKSRVEDRFSIPNEFEDTSGSDNFISGEDESLSDEDVPKDNVKIYSNRLFEFDDEYISSDVNPLFDKNECLDSGGDDDEINVLDCEDNYYDSKEDILSLESFLNDDLVHHDPSIPAMSVASILKGFIDEPPFEENDDLFDL